MDFLKKNKMTLAGGVVFVLAIYAYFTYFGGSSAPLTASNPSSSISGDLLVTLGSLHTIRLDNSIFSNPVFVSLSDFGTTLPDQPSGRRNPFAPVGKDTGAAQSTGTTTGQ